MFNLWDKDSNGYVDALELFSGLVVFANDSFEEKIRFLFDLFDLNDLNILSEIDVEYMLNCCISSTF